MAASTRRIAVASVLGAALFALGPATGAGAKHQDLKPPKTRIVAAPSETTDDATPTIEFASSEKRSTFKCKLDTDAESARGGKRCVSPLTVDALGDGTHTFSVYAIDRAGNRDETPATAAFTVDTSTRGEPAQPPAEPAQPPAEPVTPATPDQPSPTPVQPPDTAPPETTIDSGPSVFTNHVDATFTFSSTEQGSRFDCDRDGVAIDPCTSPLLLTTVPDGQHTLRVRACDAVGNCDPTPATRTWTVDATGPGIAITVGPSENGASNAHATFLFAMNPVEIGATVECKLEGEGPSPFFACSSPQSFSSLTNGKHTFTIRACDSFANCTEVKRTWTVDTVAPSVFITRGPSVVLSQTPDFQFVTEGGAATTQCALDAEAFADCTSGQALHTVTNGSHTFSVRACDAVANCATASEGFSAGTVSGPIPLSFGGTADGAQVVGDAATFTWSYSSGTAMSFTCSLNGGSFVSCDTPYNVLAPVGHNTLQIKASNAQGNNISIRHWTRTA